MMPKNPFIQMSVIAGLSSLALVLAPPAVNAQDALGGGAALDRNLGTSSGGYNSPVAIPDFRSRNDIVTGNVAGGREFRGFVGYTAERDFRSPLGSNDTFRFRADSAYSNPLVFGLGRTYDQVRFGETMGLIEVDRSGVGSNGNTLTSVGPYADLQMNAARMRLDRTLFLNNTTSTTANLVEPTIIGRGEGSKGETLLVQSSALRGISIVPPEESYGLMGLTTVDMARLQQDKEAGLAFTQPGMPFTTSFDRLNNVTPTSAGAKTTGLEPRIPGAAGKPEVNGKPEVTGNPKTNSIDNRVAANGNDDYQKILAAITDRYAKEHNIDLTKNPDEVKTLDQQYKLLRERLIGETKTVAQVKPESPNTKVTTEVPSRQGTRPAPGEFRQPGPGETGGAPPTTPGGATRPPDRIGNVESFMPKPTIGPEMNRPQPGMPTEPPALNPDAFGPILRHGQKMPTLSTADKGRFNELISAAEDRLHDGDYFWAERRFERALRFSPEKPMASAGIAHSQMGAGLYLSAALTLRDLFISHPAMIDVTYGEKALPPHERLIEIVKYARKYMNDPEKEPAGYAFLLAYLGHQLGDQAMVTEGLTKLQEVEPQNALLPLLKSIWLGGESPKSDPSAPQPSPAPAPTPEK